MPKIVPYIAGSAEIGEIFLKLRYVKRDQLARFSIKDSLKNIFPARQPDDSCASTEQSSQNERCAFPIVPVQRAAASFALRKPVNMKFIKFDDNPFEIRRPGVKNLLDQVARFRETHSVDAKIETASWRAIFAHHLIENWGRDLMIGTARTDK